MTNTEELRFAFGENWRKYLQEVTPTTIAKAEQSLVDWLGAEGLEGQRFLDIGSGSGLFSLAARRLGADVVSFDYDQDSVACTTHLREQYFPGDTHWRIAQGSVLDDGFMQTLGKYDCIYSWGVLHHTGDMWQAIENAFIAARENGRVMLAIYNDQGRGSERWTKVKKLYNGLPRVLRFLILIPAFLRLWGPTLMRDLLKGRPSASWRAYGAERGMSPWRDVVDWVGGFPFEVARPEQIFEYGKSHGFQLEKLKTCGGGLGCNEFLFRRGV